MTRYHPMPFRLELTPRLGANDGRSRATLAACRDLGLSDLPPLVVADLYFLAGEIGLGEVEALAAAVLLDPVATELRCLPITEEATPLPAPAVIEVTYLPGVTDSVADNLLAVAHRLGFAGVTAAASGLSYRFLGPVPPDVLDRIARELLANGTVQRYTVNEPIAPPFVVAAELTPDRVVVETIPLREADAGELLALSRARRLSLDLAEMEAIQAYFRREGRDPTDVELETLAQTWSEHCVHKTFKAVVSYRVAGKGTEDEAGKTNSLSEPQVIDGLLRTYIRAVTERVNKPWVRSAFVDNAGIIAFDDRFDLAFKVETHNHPSALEPFGGANTGVGGVIRDILGVSARPIANTDVLCFGPEDLPPEELPAGVLHPRRVAAGVIHGIEDYGNKMGIPTVNGAVVYHPGYTANPLVYCGCLGILPHGSHRPLHQARIGDLIVAIGGRTGRDGLRGATFSSMEMDADTATLAGTAVQIGNPIVEKQVQEVILAARDAGLYHAITDCGAGGFSSAVGEMGRHVGATVQLRGVPLKYPGLQPWEIWLSEAQERMVLAVPPAHWPVFQALCRQHDVEAAVLGTFDGSGRLRVFYGERLVADLSMEFLHEGLPRRHLQAVWTPPTVTEPDLPEPADPGAVLLRLLAHPNIRSRADILHRYDHEVQGGTAVKPLVGCDQLGPGDAVVLVPQPLVAAALPGLTSWPGVALAVGINPRYGLIDPYAMAWACVDEAFRNAVAVGADPDRVALLDNFCWGNPNLPDRLGSLVRCAQGCHDAALAYEAPFISGKDSLNNEYTDAAGRRLAIPGTLLISALGIVPDVAGTATTDLKRPGDVLYLLGETRAELGGSVYYDLHGLIGAAVPRPYPQPLARLRGLHQALRSGLVRACHDLSEGGLAVALAEMVIGGGLGATVDLAAAPTAGPLSLSQLLFAESLGRFLIEVAPEHTAAFEAMLAGQPLGRIGVVTAAPRLTIRDGGGRMCLDLTLADLTRAFVG